MSNIKEENLSSTITGAGQNNVSHLNFEKFKESFFEELEEHTNSLATIKKVKALFEKAEFQNLSEYDSRCQECGTQFNAAEGLDCPDCGSTRIERNF